MATPVEKTITRRRLRMGFATALLLSVLAFAPGLPILVEAADPVPPLSRQGAQATPPAEFPSYDGFPRGVTGPTATISPEDLAQFQQGFQKIARVAGTALIVIAILGVLLTVFWLWMLIDVIARPIPNKTPWALLVIFLGWLGAIIYFFAARRKHIRGQYPYVAEAPPSVPPAPAT